MLLERNIIILNKNSIIITIASKKTIIDYVKEYAKEERIENNNIAIINYIRLFKRILLPYELVGIK